MDATKWKAEQRDWLVRRIEFLVEKWQSEAKGFDTVFSPDVEIDKISKGRTGGCAIELGEILKEIS
jgi:hypothetical protein